MRERHQTAAVVFANLANDQFEQSKVAHTREHVQRALAITEVTLGADSGDVGLTITAMARLERYAGDLDAAIVRGAQAFGAASLVA